MTEANMKVRLQMYADILKERTDEGLRLMYADFLEDHDYPEYQYRLIRLGVRRHQLEQSRKQHPPSKAFDQAIGELMAQEWDILNANRGLIPEYQQGKEFYHQPTSRPAGEWTPETRPGFDLVMGMPGIIYCHSVQWRNWGPAKDTAAIPGLWKAVKEHPIVTVRFMDVVPRTTPVAETTGVGFPQRYFFISGNAPVAVSYSGESEDGRRHCVSEPVFTRLRPTVSSMGPDGPLMSQPDYYAFYENEREALEDLSRAAIEVALAGDEN